MTSIQQVPAATWETDWHQMSEGSQEPVGITPHTRRAPIACRRCRRLRTKCIHENADPPCQSCKNSGQAVAEECTFVGRGAQENDRDYRRKRTKLSTAATKLTQRVQVTQPVIQIPCSIPQDTYIKDLSPKSKNPRDLLPQYNDLVEGCRVFCTSCIQLGFIPKALFLERLISNESSISPFLLLSMLSISARFTPCLAQRYGINGGAANHFITCATYLVPEEMYEPTVERAQAFFLLGMAEWGRGERNRSAIYMGIAVRMAGVLRLHREETYQLPDNASADAIVNLEVARRTFWCIECHDNLYTGHNAPISFNRSDISTLLPCEENEFKFGHIISPRAALAETQAAESDPSLESLPSRSIFATLIQVHNLWGQVARQACHVDREKEPWRIDSGYRKMAARLTSFEENMPNRHRWSLWNFRGYKADSVDLAYLSIVKITRLNNLVLRRIYLEDILKSALEAKELVAADITTFWQQMSLELFTNLKQLYEAIDTFFSLRSRDEGYPAMLVFCVYVCGSLASYLWKWPQLCPALSPEAEKILQRSLEVLRTLGHAWPMATAWLNALTKVAHPPPKKTKPLSAISSQERFLSAADGLHKSPPSDEMYGIEGGEEQEAVDENHPTKHTHGLQMLSDVALDNLEQQAGQHDFTFEGNMYLPCDGEMGELYIDNFETDLSDFLNGHIQLGLMEAHFRSIHKPSTNNCTMSALQPSDYPAYTAHMGGTKSTKLLGWGNCPALILVDVCKAYFESTSPLSILSNELAAEIPATLKTIIGAARKGNVPVIWTQTRYTHPKLRDAGLLAKKMLGLDVLLASDSRNLGEFLDGLGPDIGNEDITLYKKYPSAFFGTNLSTQLLAMGVDTLVICGLCTSGGVRATALDAMQSGLRVMVVKDGCADRTREVHFGNLFDIDAKTGDVVGMEDAVAHLESGWVVQKC
ncbi:hypothetical protein BGZ60DRAFT_460984 [Tricladium varicosporioides]|nr:hypothetical protein BGZ60DRAFT_460984 [Hymenoscyphus varicosporioides]